MMKIKFSDPRIFVITIIWLMVLVFVGTVDQKYIGLYQSQKKYFSSMILWIWYIPLPGGLLTMLILTLNLIAFFFKKNVWNKKKLGVLIVHFGSILLLIGGGLTYLFSNEGAMQLTTKNKKTNFIQSYHDKELCVINLSEFKDSLEYTNFSDKILKIGNTLNFETLPFEMKVLNYCENSRLIIDNKKDSLHKGKMAKSYNFECIKSEIENSENKSAIKLLLKSIDSKLNDADGIYISRLDPGQNVQKIDYNGFEYAVILQPKRTYLPFDIELIEVTKINHPNSEIAKSYSSEVNVLDNNNIKRKLITMNNPLRFKGYTFYQAHYEEEAGIKTSVLAVVKNYGRLFPYISSIIMCIGILIQIFIRMPRLFKK